MNFQSMPAHNWDIVPHVNNPTTNNTGSARGANFHRQPLAMSGTRFSLMWVCCRVERCLCCELASTESSYKVARCCRKWQDGYNTFRIPLPTKNNRFKQRVHTWQRGNQTAVNERVYIMLYRPGKGPVEYTSTCMTFHWWSRNHDTANVWIKIPLCIYYIAVLCYCLQS
jgi:hypothetical protein